MNDNEDEKVVKLHKDHPSDYGAEVIRVHQVSDSDTSALPGLVFVQLEKDGPLFELSSQDATNLGCYLTRAAQRADIMTLHEEHAGDSGFERDIDTLRRKLGINKE
jgi:hypothetical protein